MYECMLSLDLEKWFYHTLPPLVFSLKRCIPMYLYLKGDILLQRRPSCLLAVATTLLCVLLTSLNASAHSASTIRPNTVDCSKGCHSHAYWNVTTFGGAVQFTISRPAIHDRIGYFNRFLRLQIGNDYPRLEIGISATGGGGYGDYCGSIGDGLHYFIYLWDFNHFNSFNYCKFVPLSDTDGGLYVQAVEDISCNEGDGLADEMRVTLYTPTLTLPSSGGECVDTEAGWFTRELFEEDIVDHVSGHQVAGSSWVFSQWVDVNTNFQWQTRNTDNRVAGNPPQMFWHSVPARGNNGGTLYSCDYDTGTTCTLGSS
jgi:hypothetical protein